MLTFLIILGSCFLAPLPRLGTLAGLMKLKKRVSGSGADREEAELRWAAALVGELRAGKQPVLAIVDCHEEHPIAPRAMRACRLGANISEALKQDAVNTRSLLYSASAVWEVAHSSGGSLADLLQKISEGQRKTLGVRRALHVELAGPRTTARLMSALPVLGLILGVMLGANPLSWLISSPVGIAVLLSGLSLNVFGYRWIQKIVARVEDSL